MFKGQESGKGGGQLTISLVIAIVNGKSGVISKNHVLCITLLCLLSGTVWQENSSSLGNSNMIQGHDT